MRVSSLKRLAPYGVAVISVALATVVRLKFDPLLGEGAPLLIFAIAVMLAAWFGGFWPGIVAIILSLLTVDFFFFDSKYSLFHYDSRLDQIRAVSFVIFGIISSLIFARLRESLKAEKRVRERFRLLVEGVKDYAIFMLDATGRVVSWNPGAERIKGYRANEIIGRDFSVFYTTEDIESGKPRRVLEIAAAEGRYEESAWQVRRDGSRFWASGVIAAAYDERGGLQGFTIIIRDVTERKMMEEKARFFADLNQSLQPLADPGDIMAAAARMLGEYLDVDRCAYAEIEANEKYLYITSDYARGEIPSVVGRFSVDDLGVDVLRMMRANRPFVANDVEAGALAGKDLSAYRQAGLRAMICVPLSKNGHYVARMVVSQRTPRCWEPWEVEVLKKVANRCWESVQRARAERGLRESDERYRAFIANSSEAIWRVELERPIPVNLPEDEQIEMLFKYAYLAECNDAMARMYGYETADQILGARIGDLIVRSDPRNIVHIRAFRRSGYNLTDSESHEVDRDGNTKYFLNNLTGIVENGAVVRAWGTQRDITERKRAEQALCESEKRLRRISEATQDSIWEIDLKTKRLWWNERARPLFGSRPGDLQPGLEDWYDRIHPEDVGRVKARFEKFLRNDDANWFDEYRFRRADGFYAHILDQAQKFYGENGTPILIAGAMSDITTRVQAEEALRASEERYRLLTEISPDGVVIAGDDGTIHLANQSMQHMLGVAPEQVIGRNLFDFFPSRCVDQYRDCLTDLMTSDMPEGQVEIAFRRDDGKILLAEVSAVRFDWKKRQFAQFIIHDISGRKRAEAERERLHMEIEAERNRLRQILEQMPIGVAISEAPSGRPIFCNPEAESLWLHPMLPSEDYGGYTQYGALREDGSPYEAEEYPIARSLISGEMIKGEEMRYRRGDGTETFFSVDSAPIYDSEGHRVLAVATFIDIAERKQAEATIRESEERFAKSFRASPDGLVISRISDGVILEVNDSWAELSGYDRDELIGKSTIDLGLYADPADRQRILAILEEQNYVRDLEFAIRRKSGEERLVSFSAEPLELHGEHCWLTIVRDITERRQAEEALRESEERFAKSFRTSPDALVISRISDGVILEANDSFVLLSGYERDELIGKSTIDLGLYADPADRQRILATLEEQNYVRDLEFAMRRKSGEERLVSFSAEPLELHGEHCWLTIARDITERKRAEEALRESEERFAKAFRASPDGLLITRRSDGAILEVNDSWGQMFGFASDEVVGKSWTQFDFLVDPEERRRAKAILEEQNYVRDFELAVRRKSGEALLIRISTEPIEIRGEPCFVTIIHDITQRKRYEEALRKSEEQARRQLSYVEAIYATAPVGLCFLDTNMTFLSMNERLAEIDGRSVEEHMGRTVREIMPEVADTVEPILRKVIETGEPALNLERSVATARDPGVARHFIASYYPIKNGGGRVLGVNVVVMEITERKKIEEELERLLRQEKAAREDAEAANRMKDEFLATVSHELRTPLTSILGWARMLTGGGLTAPQERHALEVIAQSAQSQNRLIEDILDTSRIITGRLKLDAHPVVIERIFHAAVDVVRPSAEAKGIVLNEVVDAPDGVVFGDANRLQQALWNLLSNAVKFTSEGGRIEARLLRAEEQVEIAVKDTGIGIEPRFLPHVFDRFRQADASSTREYGGLGIGLSIVRHIIEMHGGGVSASSPGKGRGATFMIRLPLISPLRQARPEGPRAAAPPPPPVGRRSSENGHRLDGVRVLLVEDNPDTLDMLKFIFDESGAEVIAAISVDEALDALERFRPDALVSDIAMPDRDGYDLISEIRSREPERGGKIPAVAVTAYARAEDRVKVLAAGFQMHIAKPIDPDELIAVVASLTGHIHY
jgi:PAS domain S-box-containing protein